MANIHKIFTESGVTYIDVPQDSGRLVVRAGPNLTTAAVFTSSGAGIFGSVDINGGTIDGTVIGGASAAAGSFTTLVGATSLLAGAAAASYPGILTIVGSSGEVIAGNTTNSLATFTNDSDASISIHSGTSSTGNIYFGRAGANGNTKGRLSYDHSADALVAYTAGSERLRIDSSGNVGIGTSSPASLLHLSSTQPILMFTDTDTGADSRISAGSGAGSLFIDADLNNESAGSTIQFSIDGTERARIDSSGNLLVGTSTAASLLTVNGTVTFQTSATSMGYIDYDGGDGVMRIGTHAGAAGGIDFVINGSGGGRNLKLSPTYTAFYQAGSEIARFDNSGRFLLGTSASGASILRIVGLPTSPVGLSTGDIWSNAGILTVV